MYYIFIVMSEVSEDHAAKLADSRQFYLLLN